MSKITPNLGLVLYLELKYVLCLALMKLNCVLYLI